MAGRLLLLTALLACASVATADAEEEIQKLKSMLSRMPEGSDAHEGIAQKIKDAELAALNPPKKRDPKAPPEFYGKYVRVATDVYMVKGMKGHIGYAFAFDGTRYEVEFAKGVTPMGNLMLGPMYLEHANERDAPSSLWGRKNKRPLPKKLRKKKSEL